MDDECTKAMMTCDPNVPVWCLFQKWFQTSDSGSFYAFGRIFSDKVTQGEKVRILGPNYKPGKQVDLHIKTDRKSVV